MLVNSKGPSTLAIETVILSLGPKTLTDVNVGKYRSEPLSDWNLQVAKGSMLPQSTHRITPALTKRSQSIQKAFTELPLCSQSTHRITPALTERSQSIHKAFTKHSRSGYMHNVMVERLF